MEEITDTNEIKALSEYNIKNKMTLWKKIAVLKFKTN